MTDQPTLRDRAIDAAKQALNAKGLWLTPDGRDSVVDAILAVVSPATCCVCGGGPVTYRNYREQPFCWPCADCQCGENPCVRTGVNDPAVTAEAADQHEQQRRRAAQDAAASRESERQLQAQIERQSKEIDRLRDELRFEQDLSADLRARLEATSDACSDATTALAQICELHTTELSNEFGATECRTCRDPWPCDTATILAALEPPKETPDA